MTGSDLPFSLKTFLPPLIFLLAALAVVGVAMAAIGDMDSNFGDGGYTFLDLGFNDEGIKDLIVLPDGKIMAVGQSDEEVILIRLNTDGSLDTSFDSDG